MCKCTTKIEAHLNELNYTLVRNILEGDSAPVLIEIAKLDRKKRTPSMSFVASYCPFCGNKYPKRTSRGVLRNRPVTAGDSTP